MALLSVAAVLPFAAAALALLWTSATTLRFRWTLTLALLAATWLLVAALREAVVRPLQTLSNLLGALREEDFSFRARTDGTDDALNVTHVELNALVATLREQRLGALEATGLLRNVMGAIDVAVLAVDQEGRVQLVNQAGERMLGRPAERIVGLPAADFGLASALEPPAPRVVELALPQATGRFEVRHGAVRQHGLPLQLLVLSDLSRTLREEERQAWQRLIRVLGHELNNSLTPIRSVTTSLEELLSRPQRAHDWEDDLKSGLALVSARAAALGRFMQAYARLARLPPPDLKPTRLRELVPRAVRLETRVPVAIEEGPDVEVNADPDQLEQALINLVRNAADASLETAGAVRVGWSANGRKVELWVEDEGPGLPTTTNLFVPFFTTKPSGSGIGLVLTRQIVEGHGGRLSLRNAAGHRGCRAEVVLPA